MTPCGQSAARFSLDRFRNRIQSSLPPDPVSVQVSPNVIKASIADARLVSQALEWSSRMSRTFQETLWPSRTLGQAPPA